jgi:diguanylate cyclase (GGDEF)-like protein
LGEDYVPANSRLNTVARKAIRTSSGAILVLLAISGVAILGLVLLAAVWAGSESDAAALDRQKELVNTRLQDQIARVYQETQLMGAGYSSFLAGDPVEHNEQVSASQRGNNPVSAETFGKVATTVFGYNAAFLVNSAGNLALPSDDETSNRFRWLRPLLKPLMQEVEERTQHAAGQPNGFARPGRVELLRLEGRPSIAGVVSVLSSSTSAVPVGTNLYLLVIRFLDGAALDTLSREQGLAGARYARSADQGADEVAFQINATATGEPLGFIIWKPDLPGSRVLGRLAPVLSVAGLIIAGLFFALMGRLRGSLKELHESEHHAKHLSVHDVLTGLPNRSLFATRFEKCLAGMKSEGKSAVVALIDLDRFKDVNDTYGHATGDELLRAAVARMRSAITPEDTLARVGGDEFALLLPSVERGNDHYISLCNNIVDSLRSPFQLRGGDLVIRIGASIGISVFNDHTHTANEVLRRADVALYEAKTTGRSRVILYRSSLDRRVEAKENLKSELRTLLERGPQFPASLSEAKLSDVGYLEVFFQGVYTADGQNKLSGAEALVRWRHPTHGLLSPDRFIPIAEEAGMIDQLGSWVLFNAAKAASSWPAELSVAVNVSPSQIRTWDFDRQVLSILAEVGLSPSRLELELTEAALFNIDETALATLVRLRSHGVQIALDDFGTGYSSLSHLIQFNIDRIKIDRSFVRLLGTKAEGAAIISAILGLSRTLGKATTAEGVETQGQRDFLIAAGCTNLQGFLLSRPEPLNTFLSTISRRNDGGGGDEYRDYYIQ